MVCGGDGKHRRLRRKHQAPRTKHQRNTKHQAPRGDDGWAQSGHGIHFRFRTWYTHDVSWGYCLAGWFMVQGKVFRLVEDKLGGEPKAAAAGMGGPALAGPSGPAAAAFT